MTNDHHPPAQPEGVLPRFYRICQAMDAGQLSWREITTRTGLSKRAFAKLFYSICSLEPIPRDSALRLAAALGVPLAQLLDPEPPAAGPEGDKPEAQP